MHSNRHQRMLKIGKPRKKRVSGLVRQSSKVKIEYNFYPVFISLTELCIRASYMTPVKPYSVKHYSTDAMCR
jgi:hypothetical protein